MMAVKVSGYSSLDSLVNWAASYLVDIGYVSHEGRDHRLKTTTGSEVSCLVH
jgi:hypothetical protein